jgi:aspartyl-tRNA(Asn)/glutamyl-tRNA(Gln) amidotransferase subunit A
MLGRTTRLTRPGNFLGVPAVSLNAGFTKAGMPIGMQLLGRPHDDATALRAGHAFQNATEWHKRAPAV